MTYNAGPVSSGWNGGWTLPQPIATAHVKAALELGINTFDTADTYSDGSSEVALGIALKELQVPREEVVILTKVHFTVTREKEPIAGYVNLRGNSRKHIFDGIKDSLKRLDLEYVDLLQLHRFDPETPIEETMDALHDGKLAYLVANCPEKILKITLPCSTVVKLGYARYIGSPINPYAPEWRPYVNHFAHHHHPQECHLVMPINLLLCKTMPKEKVYVFFFTKM